MNGGEGGGQAVSVPLPPYLVASGAGGTRASGILVINGVVRGTSVTNVADLVTHRGVSHYVLKSNINMKI